MTRAGDAMLRLGVEVAAALEHALTADLSTMKRSDLTLMRADLDTSKRLQTMCGQVAPWADWRTAAERVNAEIARRPATR